MTESPRGTAAPANTTSSHGAHADPHHARRWWILAVIGLAQLMIVLDITIVNIALPDAQQSLGFSNGSRQWIVTAYSLAFGGLLLLGGRLADLFGRRTTFIIGLIVFAFASALGGASPDFAVLVTARTLQGMAGALLAPAALSLLATTFTDAKERNTAFAVFGGIAGSGAAIGLLLGGVLTEYLNWRYTLYVNVAFAAIALFGAITLLPNARAEQRPQLDLPGTVIVSIALFCVVYGFANAESHPWSAPSTWGFLLAGVIGLAIFWWWQNRAPHPLLPPRVLLDRNRAGSYLTIFVIGIGMFGVFLFLTYYLQGILRYSPVITGVAFLPLVATLMFAATISTTRLLPRFGPKILVGVGMLLAAVGMVWLTRIGLHSSFASDILPPTLVEGLGIGLVMAPAMNTAVLGVAPQDAGVSSAMVNTSQQIGGSIGTALLNSLAAAAVTRYLTSRPHPTTAQAGALLQAQAQVHSYVVAFWWSAGIFAVGGVICTLLLRRGVPSGEAEGAAPMAI
jgi:EmrB/QacA subfamily drug resistance transporter